MDPEQFFTDSKVIIVAGKGGVGKTTVAATIATAASDAGLRTLVVEMEGKSGIPTLFGSDRLDFNELTLVEPGDGRGGVVARTMTPDDALVEYLRAHGLQRITSRLASAGMLELISTAVPGIRDILVLGAVKSIERSGEFDLIVLDAPAAGHAVTFMRSAAGLADAVKVGPINNQAAEVLDLLTDPERCRVMLVTTPEETPVNEMIETAFSLEDEVGVALGPVVVNGVFAALPGLATDPQVAADLAGAVLMPGEADLLREAAEFRIARTAVQVEQLDRMAGLLPLAQLAIAYEFTTDLGPAELQHMADGLTAGIRALDDLDAA